MIKKTVRYTDYNGNEKAETLYFHATKNELFDHLDLTDELEKLSAKLMDAGEEKRDLTRDEVMQILKLVKRLIKLSYGERGGADNSKFYKSDDIWKEFEASAAYDSLLMSLFEDPETAIEFMRGIMPPDLLEKANNRPATQDHLPKHSAKTTSHQEVPFSDENVQDEPDFAGMSNAEFQAAIEGKTLGDLTSAEKDQLLERGLSMSGRAGG